jgi:crotonobetaine/carnitine-CoA ligase
MLTAQAMSYMDPQWNLAASLTSGASLVILDGFHPSTFWERVREHDVTYFYCLAAMPVLLLTTPEDPRDREHRVRVIQCSAIPPARHAALEERWGAPWFEVFGMTETGGDIHVTDIEHDALVGSGAIGVAKPGREGWHRRTRAPRSGDDVGLRRRAGGNGPGLPRRVAAHRRSGTA